MNVEEGNVERRIEMLPERSHRHHQSEGWQALAADTTTTAAAIITNPTKQSLKSRQSSTSNHHTINSLKRTILTKMAWPNNNAHKIKCYLLKPLLALLLLLVTIEAINCDVICPRDTSPIHPCSCQNGTQGLLIKCTRANLAILSSALKNLNPQEQQVEQVEIEYSSVTRLFGPLFNDSQLYPFHFGLRELDIRSSGLKLIDSSALSRELQTSLQYLMLDRNQLHQIPQDLLNNLTQLRLLNLSSNSIVAIDTNTFVKLANLTELNLSNNRISRLSKGAFNSLYALEDLDLNGNEINKLEKNLFAFGRKLKTLDLSNNKLTSLDRQDFNELTSLETLRVANNQLTTVPRSIFSRNAKLYNLDLSFNKLDDIDTYLFKSVRFLRDLNMSGNLIKEITKNTFSPTTRIKRIDMSQNLIQALGPETFKNLEWLERINLSHNQIVNISNDAFNHIFSVEIDLSFNKLTRIFYYAFHEVSNITKLDLSHNLIDDGISPIAFESTDCAELDLSYNQIEDISKIPVSNLTGIRILNISHNQITEFNKKSFTQKFPLYELHTIDASYNNISQISGNILERLKSVRLLNISHNSLRRLTSGSFGNSPTLLELDLSYNNLVELVSGTLVGLISMKNLDMSYNRLKKMLPIPVALNSIHLEYNEISQLSKSAFPSLNSLLELHLDHNRISHIDEGTFSTLLALHTLSLRYNNITSVPAQALKDLASLQLLRLDGNNIQRLGKRAFGVLPIVFDLYLDHNNISSVADYAFDGMLQLLTLNLSHNNILELSPAAFAGLVSLRELDLSNNQLNRFENKTRSAMEDLLSLEVANLSNNKLSMVTQRTFLSSPYIPYKLRRLDLSNNLIGILANNFANGLKKVEWLSLRNNIINEIYPNVLGNASHLRHLDLSHNKLRTLKEGTFNGQFINLTTLLLNNNKLTQLQQVAGEFDRLRSLLNLDLSGNRLENFFIESSKWIKQRAMALDLRNNQLECTCDQLPLVAWVDSVLSKNNQTTASGLQSQHLPLPPSPSRNQGSPMATMAARPSLLSQYHHSAQLLANLSCSKPEIMNGKSIMQMVHLATNSNSQEMNCDKGYLEEADQLRRMKAPVQYTGAEPYYYDGQQLLRIGWQLIDAQLDVLNFIVIKAKFQQPFDLSQYRSSHQQRQRLTSSPAATGGSVGVASTTVAVANNPVNEGGGGGNGYYQLIEQDIERIPYNQRTLLMRGLDPSAFYVICISYESSEQPSPPFNNMIDQSKSQMSWNGSVNVSSPNELANILADYMRFNCADLNSLLRRSDSSGERLVSHAPARLNNVYLMIVCQLAILLQLWSKFRLIQF